MDDEYKDICDCLNCQKEYCNNCKDKRNTDNNILYNVFGDFMSINKACESCGVSYNAVRYKMSKGLSLQCAIVKTISDGIKAGK